MTTKLTEKNISNVSNLGISWQAVIVADGSTATSVEAGKGYFIDTTSNAHTVTLPSSPNAGDTIAIKDYAGTFATYNLTISRNGHNIQGVANNSLISTNRANVELAYIDSTKGWLFTNESNVADLQEVLYITATGGTVTTDGDYKVHSFTGDGCFVVSDAGNSAGSDSVDYLVLAGGGAGGTIIGGGGGAGGYRESVPSPAAWTASPLANPGGALSVSVQGYPIVVGGGGAGVTYGAAPNAGSASIFSSITSTGGGYGGTPGATAGIPGGSSGGGSYSQVGGTGNTPPVSPPQGNDGGNGINGPTYAGAGGGGAGGAGTNGTGPIGGPGGNGVASSITGSSVTRAGGGGGSGSINNNQLGGAGGSGGGGSGERNSPVVAATNGGTNLGGGGGGRTNNPTAGPGTNGGSGIVIIRYKFQ
jgi:hypothetical protein